jgi:DMSO/TMAO reductase YedYZ molybdopterin-dependent catalytic subunit
MPAGATPAGADFELPGLTTLRTDPDAFYVTDVQFPAPHIDVRTWRLSVRGMVDHPLVLSFGDLLEMDLQEIDATLVCVHNPVGGDRISSGRWLGVPLTALLARAGVQTDAEQLVARSIDGFTAGIPVGHILGGEPALLALAYEGVPLRVANGFPARVLCPGLWGADANTKWVTELELTTWGAVRDYWDRRGWPRVPSRVRPGSRIDLPGNRSVLRSGTVTVAGVAWAPPHGIARVDVAIDDGPWQPAELSVELAPTMWRQWRSSFDADVGEHGLRVRTIGRRGTQSEHTAPPYPVGSSGHHEIRFFAAAGGTVLYGRPVRALRSLADDLSARSTLASAGVRSWLDHGFPPPRRFPAPAPTTLARELRGSASSS